MIKLYPIILFRIWVQIILTSFVDSSANPFQLIVANQLHRLEKDLQDIKDKYENLHNKYNKQEQIISKLGKKTIQYSGSDSSTGGTYVRWGRTNCKGNSSLVYEGYAGGKHKHFGGSGSNYLCLPKQPEWGKYSYGYDMSVGRIYGVKYEMAKRKYNYPYDKHFHGQDMPCAVCQSTGRQTVLMIPARKTCPNNWHFEYTGYVMAEGHSNGRTPSEYICVDENLETIPGYDVFDQGGVYAVEVECGVLRCPPYIGGRELTCVVCSR